MKWYSHFRKQLEISNEVKYTLTIWPRNEYLGIHTRGFPGGSVVKNPPASAGDVGSAPGWGRSASPVLLPGKSDGQRSLVGSSPWGRQELDLTEHSTLHRDGFR